jgi:hypothetical protein
VSWSRGGATGTNDERDRYARLRAAAAGDRMAREAIVAEARPGLRRRLGRELEAADRDSAEALVAAVVEHGCRAAFDDISEKPGNWPMYEWLAWHVEREACGAGHSCAEVTGDRRGRSPKPREVSPCHASVL